MNLDLPSHRLTQIQLFIRVPCIWNVIKKIPVMGNWYLVVSLVKLFRTYKMTPNTGEINTRTKSERPKKQRKAKKRSWEKDVEDWIGQVSGDRLMDGRSIKAAMSRNG